MWNTQKSATKTHQLEFKNLIKHDGFAWLCISYNAFMTTRGKKAVWSFLQKRKCLYVLDESHHVKTPGAKRTKSITASGKYAPYRRVLTGTPGDKPFDIYSQLRFLDPEIWKRLGMGNFHAFKNHFGIWQTKQETQAKFGYNPGYDKLLGFKNLEELAEITASISDRVVKDDVLDLPPKLYQKVYFDMTPKQKRYYEELKNELLLWLESGELVDGTLAIVRLLRLQQITCGYVPTDEGTFTQIDTKNPRLEAAVETFSELPHQAIIWARFSADVGALVDAFQGRCVRYDGRIDDDEAARSKAAFQAGDVQFFIGNPAKGAEGLTLTGAKTVGFYSNSFKLLERLQAEDRAHRIGQDQKVLYLDFCAPGTVDEKIISNLRNKYDIASQLTGDDLKEWI